MISTARRGEEMKKMVTISIGTTNLFTIASFLNIT
jgi:hypothetical protein